MGIGTPKTETIDLCEGVNTVWHNDWWGGMEYIFHRYSWPGVCKHGDMGNDPRFENQGSLDKAREATYMFRVPYAPFYRSDRERQGVANCHSIVEPPKHSGYAALTAAVAVSAVIKGIASLADVDEVHVSHPDRVVKGSRRSAHG